MRISDWSSDVCSSDLGAILHNRLQQASEVGDLELVGAEAAAILVVRGLGSPPVVRAALRAGAMIIHDGHPWIASLCGFAGLFVPNAADLPRRIRSEEHTSELQSLMRTSYAVFCLKKNNKKQR